MTAPALPLSQIARVGFAALSEARQRLGELAAHSGVPADRWLPAFAAAADPDAALGVLLRLADRHGQPAWFTAGRIDRWQPAWPERLCRLFGASPALGEFLLRHPAALDRLLADPAPRPRDAAAYGASLAEAIAPAGATLIAEAGWCALRVRYRELLAEIAVFDLEGPEPAGRFDRVAQALSDLAGAALEVSLAVARATVAAGGGLGRPFTAEQLAETRLAIIAMGKCGAEELNVVSDVDVIFVGESRDPERLDQDTALAVATRLATEVMRGINAYAVEPPLWEVDANLRPEGSQGALVRTLGSHLAYYQRWAKTWEFQALLKARAIAGDLELGEAYVAETRPMVWASGSREDFVGSVQRMRERVTEHIPDGDLPVQIKLGPGGLRDIEFTVQLLQLVHGQNDEQLRVRGTLPGLARLAAGGYIARADAERLADTYRELRLLEHRLQLRGLSRTALMPRDEEGLRVLARASGLAPDGEALREHWEARKRLVRSLHLKIFYGPLLGAVAALPDEEFVLDGQAARQRLLAIGFRDPDGAQRHIAALSSGTSRRAAIQRNLLPVLLQWLSDGADPDYGLLCFRRISESLRDTGWYLRLLRDGADAAQRLTTVLSGSRFVGELMNSHPEAVGWLEGDAQLQAPPPGAILEEMRAIVRRYPSVDDAASRLRTVHRRELLRVAIASLVGVTDVAGVAAGLDRVHSALLTALVEGIRAALHRATPLAAGTGDDIEFLLVAMGRFGGQELGFNSDLDLIAVFRPGAVSGEPAQKRALQIVAELRRLTADPTLPIDLDFELRPEGKNGPLVRSLDSTRAYYERWSLTWEAQALLRARTLAGEPGLAEAFLAVADRVRYPASFGEDERREVRRVKARVEAERLPQGADPARHLKLGPGSLSDVEWTVQLIQLEHAGAEPPLRTTATLRALDAAVAAGHLDGADAELLREAWVLASQIRSAIRLWSNRNADVLPRNRDDAIGVARLLGYAAEATSELEERYLQATRRARVVVERVFFGRAEPRPIGGVAPYAG